MKPRSDDERKFLEFLLKKYSNPEKIIYDTKDKFDNSKLKN